MPLALTLALPTIHLNGTSAVFLIEANREAHHALGKAMDALRAAAPHARDYYPQGPEVYRQAHDEHFARLRKLSDVMTEIETICLHAMDASDR